MASPMPALASPRLGPSLEMVRNMAGGFDIDAYHVMDRRDDELVAEELLHGAMSSAFVYNFEIAGTHVIGISVVGARHLAAHYRGLRHRIVASTEKVGALFTFKLYPAREMPMLVSRNVVNELAQEPDFYSVVVEIEDIKSGNTLQVRAARGAARTPARRHSLRAAQLSDDRAEQGISERRAVDRAPGRCDPLARANAQTPQGRDDRGWRARREASQRSAVRCAARDRARSAADRGADARSNCRPRRCGARRSTSCVRQ